MELTLVPGLIILRHTGIDAFSAPDASGKLEAIAPEGLSLGFLRADLEFLSIFLKISFFQFGDEAFLFFLCHLQKMFLKEVLGFLFGARCEEGDRKACHGSEGQVTDEFSSRGMFISHFPFPLVEMEGVPVLRA